MSTASNNDLSPQVLATGCGELAGTTPAPAPVPGAGAAASAGAAAGSDQQPPLRLQKFLARAGVASRRGSEALMTAGRVRINGTVTTELGSKVDPASDVVTVDDRPVTLKDAPTYLLLNKPTGIVTTMNDPQGRPCVAQLVADAQQPALFPVGRLDRDTSGLLLFTTDGELAHRALHARYHVCKTYEATVKGTPSPAALRALREGLLLDDGLTLPAQATYQDGLLSLSITEGRKRQVRRMCAAVNHPVIDLHRSAFGPLKLDRLLLPEGQWRYLDVEEIAALRAAVGLPAV